MKALFRKYLKDLSEVALRGDAREESFYPALATLLQEVSEATRRPHVHVTTLPKPTDAGNPDFRLWNGTDRIIGYIEAKRPTEERLDLIEGSDQLQRYRSTFPNLILTNFLEFRLYRNGERVDTVLAGRVKKETTASAKEKKRACDTIRVSSGYPSTRPSISPQYPILYGRIA